MVNWDVVSKNVDGLTEFVRESWKKACRLTLLVPYFLLQAATGDRVCNC